MMTTSTRWLGWMVAALVLLLIASCGPSNDPAVEEVLSHTINIESARFKALTPEQQAAVLRRAKEKGRPIIGNAKRYYPGSLRSKPSQ
jgi:hypothetical protein